LTLVEGPLPTKASETPRTFRLCRFASETVPVIVSPATISVRSSAASMYGMSAAGPIALVAKVPGTAGPTSCGAQ
jgi:hypothetical protein